MKSVEEYFEYRQFLLCGIPSIEMKGTLEDWQLDLLVSDTWLDTGIGYWYRYPMTRYYERLLDTRSS